MKLRKPGRMNDRKGKTWVNTKDYPPPVEFVKLHLMAESK